MGKGVRLVNVHLFIPDLTPGGAERVFATLCRLWNHHQDALTLVVLRKEGPYFAHLPPKLRVVELGSTRLLFALPRLFRLWKKEKPDVVLSTQAHVNAAVGWLSRWLTQTKFVGRETSVPSQARRMKKQSALSAAIFRAGYRSLARIICPSEIVSAELQASYRIASHRLAVVPNPVDFETIAALAGASLPDGRLDFFAHRKVFVASGRLEPVKGFDLLLRAASLLPSEFAFVFLGDGKLRSELEKMTKHLRLDDRVLFQGFDDNPHRWTSRAVGFVLSSRYEGYPNAVLEALVLGVPAAAFACPGGVVEIVIEGQNGTLALPESPESLADAVLRLSETSWDRNAIAQQARQRFGGAAIAQQYRTILAEVANE